MDLKSFSSLAELLVARMDEVELGRPISWKQFGGIYLAFGLKELYFKTLLLSVVCGFNRHGLLVPQKCAKSRFIDWSIHRRK